MSDVLVEIQNLEKKIEQSAKENRAMHSATHSMLAEGNREARENAIKIQAMLTDAQVMISDNKKTAVNGMVIIQKSLEVILNREENVPEEIQDLKQKFKNFGFDANDGSG